MRQLIFRTTNLQDFEILKHEHMPLGTELAQSKTVSKAMLIKELEKTNDTGETEETISEFNTLKSPEILYQKTTTRRTIKIINFTERHIRTFYNKKYYKIIHCNAIIILITSNDRVNKIIIHPYKEYQGLKTKLFKNPYPNMYGGNKSCLGSIDRKEEETDLKTILKLLEGSYTHINTDFKGALSKTKTAFDYLSKNPFPYNQLETTKETLATVLEQVKANKI